MICSFEGQRSLQLRPIQILNGDGYQLTEEDPTMFPLQKQYQVQNKDPCCDVSLFVPLL